MIETISFWKILWEYCRQRRKLLCLLLVLAAINGFLFAVYHLEWEALWYMLLLWAVVGLIAAVMDFWLFYSRHKKLESLRANIRYTLEELPQPRNLIEADYDDALRAVFSEKQRVESAADQEKGAMLEYYTLWAHQIKTPIAALRLLLQSEETEWSRDALAELFRVEQYVEMVLSYLRLGSTTNDFVIQEYPLEGIVRQAVRKYAPLFIRKKIQLEMEPLPSKVLTDEKWLCFVVEQILSNALKYTPKGKITIREEPGKALVIEDTGIGIAPEDLPRIFEKGFTGRNGREDKRATGLGLYLCREVLQKLSHKMRIDSQPGKGTQVRVLLNQVELGKE